MSTTHRDRRPLRRVPTHITSTRRFSASMLRTVAIALTAFGLALPACKDDKVLPPPVAALAPVPAPAGHVADVFVPAPDTTWQQVRTKIGGPMALLPATFPAAVVTMLGLSPQLLEQIDANLPSYGVVTDDGKRTALVVGVHVREGARVVTLMTEGADAKYTARTDPSGVTVFEPKPSNTARAAALGVAGNYLVWGETADDLARGGPYVSRTLPTRPAEKGHVVIVAPRPALAGPLAKRVRDGWSAFRKEKEQDDQKLRQEHGGKAPDFGEPAAALADVDGKVSRLATLLADLELARLTIDLDEHGVHARVAMTPASGGGPATQEFSAMVTGDSAPLAALPQSTVFGILVRDSLEVRKQAAVDQADSVTKILGERIKPDDTKKVQDALTAWSQGRGDWLAAGYDASRDGKAFVVEGALADNKQLDTAIRSLLALTSVPAFKEPIEHYVGKLTIGKPAMADGSTLVHVKRAPATKDSKIEKSEFDLAWQAADKAPVFTFVTSQDARAWFKERGNEPGKTLASRPDLAPSLQALGNEVAFAFFLEPNRLIASLTMREPRGDAPAAPMLFSYGGNKSAGWLRLDLSDQAARELVKMAARR